MSLLYIKATFEELIQPLLHLRGCDNRIQDDDIHIQLGTIPSLHHSQLLTSSDVAIKARHSPSYTDD